MVSKFFGLLNVSDLEAIEKAIEELEKKTSGEIVVKCASASSSYLQVQLLGTLLGFLLGVLTVALCERGAHWSLHSFDVVLILAAGALCGYALARIPWVLRRLLPDSHTLQRVARAAQWEFTQLGLIETRDRTGILIYISALEHRVHLLADKGIHAKLDPGVWQKQVNQVIEGIKNDDTAGALVRSINEMGTLLAKHFPLKPGETNELSNRVRLGHGVLVGSPE